LLRSSGVSDPAAALVDTAVTDRLGAKDTGVILAYNRKYPFKRDDTLPDTPALKHVFMSYSRKDEAVMQRVVGFLRKQGLNAWVDNEKLVSGTPIREI